MARPQCVTVNGSVPAYAVLRPGACSSALSPVPLSFKGCFPSSSCHRPHRCYLCWLRCGAARLRPGIPKASCMSLSLVLPSASSIGPYQIVFCLPRVVAGGSDPQFCILPHSPNFLSDINLILVICSACPLPSVAGNQEERERGCPVFYSLGMDSSPSRDLAI